MHTKKMLLPTLAMTIVAGQICGAILNVRADGGRGYNCPELAVEYVHGYGWDKSSTEDSLAFEEALWEKLWPDYDSNPASTPLIDVEFSAGASGVDFVERPGWLQAVNAKLNPIEKQELRKSVSEGGRLVANKVNYDEHVDRCANTKYVLAGFGMGAAKVREALQYINPEKVLYVALFSDPTLYLPEGSGLFPDACRGANLSSYRMYVPNCRTYAGVLGGVNPYVPAGYENKLGTWCNNNDMFCGAGISMNGHARYEEDGIYEDAAKVIYDKVRQNFNLQPLYSKHDTAILIDSTGSMKSLIDRYKNEALVLAKRTLENGGRIALYDYRDYKDSYAPVQHCSFETCTLEKFQEELNGITADGGGDTPESLLWSSKLAMNELHWERGATKSLVVLTDAGFHDPDLDGTTLADIVKLSKEIDPVNMYVIAPGATMSEYGDLTTATGGMVVSATSDLSMLTNSIMERYDSLPRVEEMESDEHYDDTSDEEILRLLRIELGANDDMGVEELLELLNMTALAGNERTTEDDAEIPDNDSGMPETASATTDSDVIIPKTPDTGRK